MININDKTIYEIENLFKERSYQKFRAKQVFRAIHVNRLNDFDEMTDLPLKMREDLKADFKFERINVLKTFESKIDSTKKYLLELPDKNIVEAVYMDYKDRSTICISSQVGCRMGCSFCASTKNGLVRNMTTSELIEEVYLLERLNGPISNIVIMGIGEPLDNFAHIKKFIEIITDPSGRNLSHRSITLSTSGLSPRIKDLADTGLDVNLALSLHYADDKKRAVYMPVAKKYSIKDLIDATDYYFDKTGRRVSFEYVVIDGVNNLTEDVENLHDLLFGKNVHINLIPLNPIEEFDHKKPGARVLEDFKQRLIKRGLNATIRRSMGIDIDASCGQLRNNYAR
ncbi:23S rRNA (adenine(2503)-C(2))-methyltransferase RlmN [Anaerococcus lactolyticus]|uniref:Probable dual-specificity RNA methyltransferase RlmN n=1 Tax=Anaerococcus lactolyticus S7-1-13 TaxID=1284686 RepID=A0A095X120_9FIRM|nr:23S rRNA (adenine(2503)-C(2))-methyltransferase RlmN [Anaerococcus lactolyticus]KGF03538.1 ribosomal RNA large subunit methyltransferase N [Anaerococcus lactolyticus S7-1-13]